MTQMQAQDIVNALNMIVVELRVLNERIESLITDYSEDKRFKIDISCEDSTMISADIANRFAPILV